MANEVPEPTPGDGAPPAAHQHRATARRGRLPPPPRDTRPYACTSQVRPLRAGWLGNQPGPIARPEGATGGSTVAARGRCVEVVFLPWDPSALQILWRSRKCSTPLGAVRGAAAGAERRGRLRLMPGGGVAPASTPLARAAARRSSRSVCGACVRTGGGNNDNLRRAYLGTIMSSEARDRRNFLIGARSTQVATFWGRRVKMTKFDFSHPHLQIQE